MQRRTINLVCAFVVAGCVLGCREGFNSDVTPTQPTPLLDGFSSRQKAAEVEDALRREGRSITVLEEGAGKAVQSKARPPLSVRILRVSPFKLWGFDGDVRLEFVDGELASTWFYPRDPGQFDAETKKRALNVEPSRPLRLHAATELRSDVDYSGAKYWAWEDVHLRQKVEKWIKQNA
jgi:hypothetical protein